MKSICCDKNRPGKLENCIFSQERQLFAEDELPLIHGSFSTLNQAYNAILKWIEANGYHISGPNRELNLEYERGGDQSKFVAEVQFPVEKH